MPFAYPPVITKSDYVDGAGLARAESLGSDAPVGSTTECPLKKKDSPPPAPKTCAVTELTVSAGGKTSTSFTTPDHAPIASDAARVCFAPKLEKASIAWKLDNGDLATSGLLEIFIRGRGLPVWSKELTAEDLAAGIWEYEGESADADVFDEGYLTVERSPYKVKLTLTGGPVAQDGELAYSYFDVLVHSITLSWGDYALVPKDRADVDGSYLVRLYGKAQPKTKGYEETILDELKAKNASPAAGAAHEVALWSNLFAKKDAGAMEVEEYVKPTDFEEHKKLWGNGTRIPIVAKVLVKKSDGQGTDAAPQALAGCRLMWDWIAPGLRKWRDGLSPTAKTEDFLRDIFSQNQSVVPKDIANCPVELGGKLGDDGARIFPDQTGTTAFPYPVAAASQRKWASFSYFPTVGTDAERCTTGVLFQPSRIGGDRYHVVCALVFDDALDTADDLAPPPGASADAGTFEVFKKVTLHYLVRGGAPQLACDPANIEAKIKDVYKTESKMIVDVRRVAIDEAAYGRAIVQAIADVEKKPTAYTQYPCMPLLARHIVNRTPPANSPGVVLKSKADTLSAMENTFRAGGLRILSGVAGLKEGEEIAGQSSGNKGLPLATSATTADRPIFMLVDAANAPADGEVIEGQATHVQGRAKITGRSCWGHTYAEATSTDRRYETTVQVALGGQTATVAFAKTGFKRSLSTTVDRTAKEELAAALKRAAAGFDESQPLAITLTHKGSDSEHHKERIANLKLAIDELLSSTSGTLIDRKVVFENLKTRDLSPISDEAVYRQAFQKNFAVGWMIQAIVSAYVSAQHAADEGIFLLHIPGRTNVRDLPELASRFQDLKVAGAFYGDAFPGNRHKTVTYIATLDPNGPAMFKEDTKSIESIFAHEVGHAIFLPHAPKANPKAVDPAQLKEGCHVQGDNCLMNYDVDSEHFCGICMLRLRGWNWTPLPNSLGEQEYQVTLELDDVDSIFTTDANSTRGRRERLQVLGLMYLALDHPEADACADFAWQHCKELFPELEGASGTLIRDRMRELVRETLVEGGRLPAPGSFAKIRAPGGYQVAYSQNHLEARFSAAEQGKDPAKPYEKLMLSASRFAAEQAVCDANPALGKIPLKVTVRRRPKGSDEAWEECDPGRGAKVYFELVPPDDVAGAPPGPAFTTVVGGKAYHTTAKAPDLQAAPSAYLAQKVTAHKPAGGGDPDRKNVHADLGGKRGTPVFCKTRDEGFAPIPYDGTFKFAAVVEADDDGVARVVFAPSRVGGDSYRLRVFVGPVTQPKTAQDLANGGDDVVETGTMVRWRMVRVCHDIAMSPAADATEAPPDSCKRADGSLMPNVDKYFGDLPALDLAGALTTELAKSYCELIIEPEAEATVSISLYEDDVTRTARDLLRQYPRYNAPANAKMSIFREPMVVEPGSGDRKFRAVLPTAPQPGTVTVRPRDGGPDTALLTDKDGITDVTQRGGQVLADARIDYATSTIAVTFSAAQTGSNYEVCYFPTAFVDLDSLLSFPATSPFLFNLALPRVYNAAIGPGTKPADSNPLDETAKPVQFHTFLDAQTLGLVKGLLLDAAARGIRRNNGFYPGLLFFRAHRVDNYTAIWETGTQEGKGAGNGIFLFDVAGGHDPARYASLCVHEMSHGLFLMHAPNVQNAKPEQHDPADRYCVMSYDANDGDHCGQCVAALRGINTRVAPFR